MAKASDEFDPNDPESAVRQRILAQYTTDPANDPNGGTATAAPPPAQFNVDQPAPPQRFDAPGSSNESYVPPPPDTPSAAPTAPTVPAAGGAARPPGFEVSQGFPSQWAPGATAPSNAPTGYHWDASLADFAPNPGGSATPGFADVPGFDTAKINDPSHVNDKYTPAMRVFSQGLSVGIPLTRGNLSAQVQWAQSHGFPHAKQVGDDSVDYGDGHGPIDLIRSDGATMFLDRAVWGGGAAPAGATGGTGATAAGGASPSLQALLASLGGGMGGGTASAAPQGLWTSDFTQQLRQMLMQRLQAAGQPVDVNDPNISTALTAARDEATRASDTERTQLAERLYASGGLNTNALTQGIQQSNERNAVGLGSLRAKLVMQEATARRDELKSLMTLAVQSGDMETARMVQMQLAALQAQLTREGFGVSLAEFGQNQNAQAGNPGNY